MTNYELKSEAAVLQALADGNLVAIPTESSFALAGRVDRPEALSTLRRYKPERNAPVGLMMGDQAFLQEYVAEVTDLQQELMQAHWPGPVSIVFTADSSLSEVIKAGSGSVAVRVPAEPWLSELLHKVGVPLTATSANRSGEPPVCDIEVLASQFPELYRYMGVRRTPGGAPSTLVDGRGSKPVVLREGAVKIPEQR